MIYNTKIAVYFFLIAFASLWGCSSSKKTAQSKKIAPEWVSSRPLSSQYYVGIGSASLKSVKFKDFQASAKDESLNDLAQDISVELSSLSLIHNFEKNSKLKDVYYSEIKTKAKQNFENYEIVETYNDGEKYWVYTRLSKALYHEQRAQKKANTVNRTLALFENARKSSENGQVKNAITLGISALNEVSEYIGESTPAQINGETRELPQAIYTFLLNELNSIKFTPSVPQTRAKKGEVPELGKFSFSITTRKNIPAAHIPVRIEFSGIGLQENQTVSNDNGVAGIKLGVINSNNTIESLSITIDLSKLASQATSLSVKSMIREILPSKGEIVFYLDEPKLFIESELTIGGNKTPLNSINQLIAKQCGEKNIMVLTDKNNANFILQVAISIETVKENNNRYNSKAVMSIKLSDLKNKLIYNKQTFEISKPGSNSQQAVENTIKEAENLIRIKYFDEVYSKLK